MTKVTGIPAITAKLLLTTALAFGASTFALADDDGHSGGKDKVLYTGRRTRLTLRRIFWR